VAFTFTALQLPVTVLGSAYLFRYSGSTDWLLHIAVRYYVAAVTVAYAFTTLPPSVVTAVSSRMFTVWRTFTVLPTLPATPHHYTPTWMHTYIPRSFTRLARVVVHILIHLLARLTLPRHTCLRYGWTVPASILLRLLHTPAVVLRLPDITCGLTIHTRTRITSFLTFWFCWRTVTSRFIGYPRAATHTLRFWFYRLYHMVGSLPATTSAVTAACGRLPYLQFIRSGYLPSTFWFMQYLRTLPTRYTVTRHTLPHVLPCHTVATAHLPRATTAHHTCLWFYLYTTHVAVATPRLPLLPFGRSGPTLRTAWFWLDYRRLYILLPARARTLHTATHLHLLYTCPTAPHAFTLLRLPTLRSWFFGYLDGLPTLYYGRSHLHAVDVYGLFVRTYTRSTVAFTRSSTRLVTAPHLSCSSAVYRLVAATPRTVTTCLPRFKRYTALHCSPHFTPTRTAALPLHRTFPHRFGLVLDCYLTYHVPGSYGRERRLHWFADTVVDRLLPYLCWLRFAYAPPTTFCIHTYTLPLVCVLAVACVLPAGYHTQRVLPPLHIRITTVCTRTVAICRTYTFCRAAGRITVLTAYCHVAYRFWLLVYLRLDYLCLPYV